MSTELIAKLLAANVGSRELDARIAVAVGYQHEDVHGRKFTIVVADHGYRNFGDDDWDSWRVPAYTTDLGAALSLVPKAEPRLHWSIERYPAGTHTAIVSDKWPVGNHYCGQNADEPAIAVCIAVLRMREEQP